MIVCFILRIEVICDRPPFAVICEWVDHLIERCNVMFEKVFNWSKSFKSAEVYRKLKIDDTAGTDEIRRSYEFEQMFVLDYEEYLDEDDVNSKYMLKLRQKEDHFDDIETY